MKIKEKVAESQQDAVRISRQQQTQVSDKDKRAALIQKAKESVSDSVDVSVAKMIADQLDPTKMAAERREKIERLKQLIASGNYKPSSEAVAQSISDEISLEIMDAGKVEGI